MAKKEVKEETTATETPSAPRGPSAAMLALFMPSGAVKLENTKRLNLPPMLRPNDFPMDAVLQGEILQIIDSPVTTVKGKLVWLRLEGGRELTFPITGVIRCALAPGVAADDRKTLQTALDRYVGKVLTLKRGLDGSSEKFKRNVYMFEVFLSDKAK